MNGTRSRRGETNAKLPRVLRVAAGHEGRGFFVPDLHEPDLILALAQCFHDAVDAIAGKTENLGDTPVNQAIDQQFRRAVAAMFTFFLMHRVLHGRRHGRSPLLRWLSEYTYAATACSWRSVSV